MARPGLEMRVAEAKQRDIGKKRARMDGPDIASMGASPGDIVEVRGGRTSSAVVWPADEGARAAGTVCIDGQTRKNAGAAIGEQVLVRRVQARPAKSVSLVPVGGAVAPDGDFTEFVRGRLKGMPVSAGDEISVMILGSSVDFKVARAAPGPVARISRSTDLSISAESVDRKPRVTYEEVGGMGQAIAALKEIVEVPLRHPEVSARLGIEAHSGVLLYGPPGCGKTLLAKAIASESEASMHPINGPEIMNKYYGESEARLREIFQEAREGAPSIIFIDEIDALAPRREEAYGDVEKRVVAQLLALMDGLDERGNVVVLGATNRPDGVDPALRRPGRFDREFEISVPNEDGRHEVLLIHTRGMPLAGGVDLRRLAADLHGYTGADIRSLCREAALHAMRRYLPSVDLETERIPARVLKSMEIQLDDFYEAMHEVVPTAMREFYVERPRVSWSEVGGLGGIKRSLEDNLLAALRDPSRFSKMGVRPPRGALLYGPPGCGKTMLGRALASESGANMIMVRGPGILSKWVGESEKAVREIFRKAKASSPCVVIFDEMDALARSRSEDGAPAGDSVLTQMLAEMEDVGPSSRVVVLGMTNRPDLLDRALLRTGRLDLALYVPPPDEAGRLQIIRSLTERMPLEADVRPEEIAVATANYTGADLAALCREAAVHAMRAGSERIGGSDFAAGLGNVRPSISKDVDAWYDSVRQSMSDAVPRAADKAFYG